MKFFSLVILNRDAPFNSEPDLRAMVKTLMWPFRDRACFELSDGEHEDDPGLIALGRWDGYIDHPKEMLDHYGYDVSAIPSDDAMVVVELDEIDADDFGRNGRLGQPDILTPDGVWMYGPKTRASDVDEWLLRALAVVAKYTGHRGILLFCRH